jgi:hypothetical protein
MKVCDTAMVSDSYVVVTLHTATTSVSWKSRPKWRTLLVQSKFVVNFGSKKPSLLHKYRETFARTTVKDHPSRLFPCVTKVMDVLYVTRSKRSTSVEAVQQITGSFALVTRKPITSRFYRIISRHVIQIGGYAEGARCHGRLNPHRLFITDIR